MNSCTSEEQVKIRVEKRDSYDYRMLGGYEYKSGESRLQRTTGRPRSKERRGQVRV